MKLIIAGSRTIMNFSLVYHFFNNIVQPLHIVNEIISGGAIGVDQIGERIAKSNNIKLKIFPANWDKYGKSAGYRRNVEMAEYADALLLVWDGKSKGSGHMKDIAISKGLEIFEYII